MIQVYNFIYIYTSLLPTVETRRLHFNNQIFSYLAICTKCRKNHRKRVTSEAEWLQPESTDESAPRQPRALPAAEPLRSTVGSASLI